MLYLNTKGCVTMLWGIDLFYSEMEAMKLKKYHFNLVAYKVKYIWCQDAAASIEFSFCYYFHVL